MGRPRTLDEQILVSLVGAAGMERARRLAEQMYNGERENDVLRGLVLDRRLLAVQARVTASQVMASCPCNANPYQMCEHVAALLLRWSQDQDAFPPPQVVTIEVGGKQVEAVAQKPAPSVPHDEPPTWLTSSLATRQAQERQVLADLLDGFRLQDLRDMAGQHDWTVRGQRKAEVKAQVAEQMAAPAHLQQAFRELDDEHRRVLRALVLLWGEHQVSAATVARVASLNKPLKRHKNVTTYLQHLCQAGLALPGATIADYDLACDFVPPALARHLVPLLSGDLPAGLEQPDGRAGSRVVPADPRRLGYAAHQILTLLRQAPVALQPPPPRPRLARNVPQLASWDYDLAEVLALDSDNKLQTSANLHLTVPPPPRALAAEDSERLLPVAGSEAQLDMLYNLLLASGLILPGSPVTVADEVYAEFLRRDEATQHAILVRAYLATAQGESIWEIVRQHPEMQVKRSWRYAQIHPQYLRGQLRSFFLAFLRVLACLPDGRWLSLGGLTPLLRAVWPRFDALAWDTLWLGSQVAMWHLANNGRPLKPDNPADWEAAQGRFVRQEIAGPLHWLGLADLQYDGQDLVAFRLRGLADLYWDRVEALPLSGLAGQPTGAGAAEVQVGADLTIVVNPSAIGAAASALLGRVARLETVQPGRFVYRLDRQAAYDTFESGTTLDEIRATWQELLAGPIPPAIGEQLAAWWAAYGQVRLYRDLTVVELGDDYVLAEIRAVTALDQALVAQVSPRLIIVRSDAVAALVAELQRAGYTPKQTDLVE